MASKHCQTDPQQPGNDPEAPKLVPDDELGQRPEEESTQQIQRPGGGGAPGTGDEPPVTAIPLSLEEGVTEDQLEKSGRESDPV